MVFFVVPIPGKVVDAATNRTTQLYNSYKKPPPATSLGDEEKETDNDKGEGPSESSSSPHASQLNPPSAAPGRRAPPPMRAHPAAPPSRGQPARGSVSASASASSPASASAAAPATSAPATNETDATSAFGMQLLAHTLDSISLLETMGVITCQAAASIRSQLADPALSQQHETPAPSPVEVAAQRTQPPPPRRKSSAPAEIRGTALWDYGVNGDPDDLVFSAGDTVIVDEEVNGDWCRGRTIPAGSAVPLPKRGLFPANYIERH